MIARGFLLALAVALAACASLDRYDRTYSLVVSDGKESISAGVTLHPRDPKP